MKNFKISRKDKIFQILQQQQPTDDADDALLPFFLLLIIQFLYYFFNTRYTIIWKPALGQHAGLPPVRGRQVRRAGGWLVCL